MSESRMNAKDNGAENTKATDAEKFTQVIDAKDNVTLAASIAGSGEKLQAQGVLPKVEITFDNDSKSGSGDLRPALQYAAKNFEKLDGDKDGHVTEDEIDDYIEKNESLSKEDIAKLTKLREKVGDVEEVSNDEWGDENSGITEKDIAMASKQVDGLAYAQQNFDKLDGNGDGHVTADEISGYVKANENLSASELKTLNALKKSVSDLQSKHNDEWGFENDGFTRHDLLDALQELGSPDARVASDRRLPGIAITPASPEAPKVEAPKVEAPKVEAPKVEAPKVEAPKVEAPKVEAPKVEAPKVEAPKVEAPKVEAPKVEAPKVEAPKEEALKVEAPKEDSKSAQKKVADYEVKKGDSMWKISKEELMKANGGKEPTGREVLKKMDEVAKANHMKVTDTIHPGQKLQLPCGLETIENNTGRKQEVRKTETTGTKQEQKTETVPPQKIESATELMKNRFAELDKDGNNHVTEKEIKDYITAHEKTMTARETQVMKGFSERVKDVQKLANDERGIENSGISMDDLNKLDELQKGSAQFLKSGSFGKIDENGNEFLSKDELNKALNAGNLTREQRVSLEFLRDNLKILQKGANDERGFENNGVSMKDLSTFAQIA